MKINLQKLLLTAFLFLYNLTTFSQSFEWVKTIGASDFDAGYSIAIDNFGNIYTTGVYTGTVDFDPGSGVYNLTSTQPYINKDIYILKTDSDGNFLWAKSVGGINEDYSKSIKVDNSGNVYVTGQFVGVADFDPGPETFNVYSAGDDAFVLKLDTNGNFLWAKSFGNNAYSLAVDDTENVYITGDFYSNTDFNPGAESHMLYDNGYGNVFILKLDVSGNFVWARSFGGDTYDRGMSIAVDNSNNIFVTGYAQVTGGTDVFIIKFNESGNLIWTKSLGNNNHLNYGHAIDTDTTGNIYVIGQFQYIVDFDPNDDIYNLTAGEGWNDVFILKLDTGGNFIWAKSFGGIGEEYPSNMILDNYGNIYTTGFFDNTADFDPGADIFNLTPYQDGFIDVFVQKLDTNGNFLWANSFGGSNMDYGNSIALDSSNNYYIVGSFRGFADFDPGAGTSNITSTGDYDVFIKKMSQNNALGIEDFSNKNEVVVYPNPTNGQINIKLNNEINNVKIIVSDLLGRIITEKNYSKLLNTNINLPNKKGLYFVTLKNLIGSKTIKILKQ
ncbi:SBBP repeat-containing protein [Tenacibaculum sp. IB213877]|uniref:SBBP repeat-containing protein n=1 Tax=Tenacibaculum sp. IB213877 TaxID=3097351 RepID=UPI002A5AAB99|nr:SBBP repeat-containing protein [Tenacibaculum sp. IB213877]MDY0779922.1 SBBP repeat-containing protein [Tenacibaculum sp. IB213877]